jgi:hypothetical protein
MDHSAIKYRILMEKTHIGQRRDEVVACYPIVPPGLLQRHFGGLEML